MSDPSDTGISGRQNPSGSIDPARMREDLRAAGREARMAAGEAASAVKQEGAALLDTAKDRVEGLAEDTRQAGAERTQGLARAIHRAADELERDSPQIARLVHDAAGSVDEVARAIRERSPREMLHSAEDFARRHPLLFMGAAALAGFAVARFARSSAEHRRHAMSRREMEYGMHGRPGMAGTQAMGSGSTGRYAPGMPGGHDAPASAGLGSAGATGGLAGSAGAGSSTYPRGPATPHDTTTGAPGWVADQEGKAKPATMGSASLGGSAALRPRGGSENG